jgi:signal transduction histidine kinase
LQAEERLQADLTLQSMLDSAQEITLLVGADFRLIKCNKAAYQAMRAIQPDKEPEIGTDLREYSPIPISTVERDFANVLQGQSVSFDIDVQDALQPHEKRTFEVQYNPVRNLQGEIIAVSFVARNITQRRIAQEQIERANAWLEERVQERTQDLELQAQELSAANTKLRVAYSELELSQLRIWESQQKLEAVNRSLEEANTEKNEIMGIVAHDLKSPLSGIQGLAELLAAGGVAEAEQVKEVGLQMFRSTERMFSLITNLLSLNTIEAGQMPIRITTVALNPIVESFVEIYANQAATKDITIMAEIPSALLFGLVDELAFRQVLDNLISNAVKYSPYGKNVYVRLKADNNLIRLEVQDEGPGISEDDMQKLFGKFARLSARPTGGEHSTGLGLSIVKKMVESMNGKVWCESELGNGATFIVELPMAKN